MTKQNSQEDYMTVLIIIALLCMGCVASCVNNVPFMYMYTVAMALQWEHNFKNLIPNSGNRIFKTKTL